MSTSAFTRGEPRAGAREWWGLAVLALPTLVLGMDMTVLHLAVPSMSADLAPDGVRLLWIVDIYGFLIAGFLVPMGALGDRFGRRRLLVLGSACFALATAWAARATSAETLIAARALMGAAGATLMPSTLSLISTMFRLPRQRGLAVGVWAAAFSCGLAVGPAVGGVLLAYFQWGSVFLVGVPIMALVLVTAPVLLPESRDPAAGRIDPLSVVLSLAAVLPVVHGFKELAGGDDLPIAGVTIAAGAFSATLFVRRQHRLTEPLLDLGLFRHRGRAGALVILLVSAGTSAGIYLFVAQHLQLVNRMSTMESGLWLVPAAAVMLVTSVLAPLVARRVRPAYVIATALLASAVGFLLLTGVRPESSPLLVVVGFTLVYAGGSPVTTLATDLVVGSAPPGKAGAASAVSETGTELGVAMGVATLGIAGTVVYRDRIAGVTGGDTLADAVATAQRMPPEAATRLLGTARDAFSTGMNVTALGCALVLAVLATAAVVLLRHVAPSGAHDDAATVE